MAPQRGCERALDPGPRDAVGANDVDHLEIPLVPRFHLQRREACYLGAFGREEMKAPAVTGGAEKRSQLRVAKHAPCSKIQGTKSSTRDSALFQIMVISGQLYTFFSMPLLMWNSLKIYLSWSL